ncbi:TetR/AcrR family transcriptional regulator [Syntrophomonas wolfei]|jgi:AcrR family transcriptional regulator|uniref:TetR/AcrR family transcriptional regulator n=1 Tax=Syntrophomonas wolfei TaxID=863 RepID=UPI0023F4A3B2|nr:TetR/AcrR family transcriptional regulator [Syntrophomonas wolfei]
MVTAFTDQEREIIRSELKAAASEYASNIGMRKTTVDQLAARAGISKGAFYKFYDSKEMLFFEVVEDWHTELYNRAWEVFQNNAGMDDRERLAETLLEICRVVQEYSLMNFFENDVPYLLRKIPQEILQAHYHSEAVHIKELIRRSGISLKVSLEVAAAVVHGLTLTLSHRYEIGENYSQVLEILIRGACDRIIGV